MKNILALLSVAFGACTCAERSWYGVDHDTACPCYYTKAARYELENVKELIALCRNDIFTDAPEYATRVTQIRNILSTL